MVKNQLSKVIKALTTELILAQSNPDEAIMQFKECEIELSVEIETEASGKTSIWVIEFEAGASRTQTNTVKIKFDPTKILVFNVNTSDEAPKNVKQT